MLILVISGLVFSITPHVECKFDYEYSLNNEGWFKLHKVTATWQDAFFQCHNEGAVLTSPITKDMWYHMGMLIDANNDTLSYFIGTHARFSPGQFVSIEGVPLENMPITDMFEILHTNDGECLSTDGFHISVVSCSQRLPYICYMKNEVGKKLSECGTFDKEYRLDSTTGSCYKLHRDVRTWPEANALCITEGGHLAILNNELEARVVKSLIPDIRLGFTWEAKWDPLYIGLRDWNGKGNGTWLSIHGQPVDQLYNNWHEEQPDGLGQLCGALLRDGTLDNVWCHLASFFICEKKAENTRYDGYGDQY